jgi:Fe-S-cluster formation regulator IscX/YfhJ
MVASPKGLGSQKDCTGKASSIYKRHPDSDPRKTALARASSIYKRHPDSDPRKTALARPAAYIVQ